MAYQLRIWKAEGISIDEWKRAVNSCSIAKIDNTDLEMLNPKTGQTITFPANEGDVAVKFSKGGFFGIGAKVTWEKCIGFSHGYGSLRYTENLESPENEVRKAVSAISKALNAKIIGEEDEQYDW
ncbi:hypothetical protein TDB9533_03163 [Thalassocella blandensis]|nr:hypothetical protein TDB9533_03163 [Thalassocella blandensis]